MKKLLFFVVTLISLSFSVYANDRPFKVALYAPDGNNITKQQVTKYLVSHFDNDYDKLAAIAYWIASHISYDDYKYDGSANLKEMSYKYDIFKHRTGICSDFALLFQEMAKLANISKVEVVSGYVIDADRIKRFYHKKDMPGDGHAWNKVTIEGRSFFVDTTFMSNGRLRDGSNRRPSSFRHKMDVKKNAKRREINKNIDDFYFDFTPKKEVKAYHQIHLSNKYIK